MGVKELSDKVKSAAHRVTHLDTSFIKESYKNQLLEKYGSALPAGQPKDMGDSNGD